MVLDCCPLSGYFLFTAQLDVMDVRLEAWNSRAGIFGLEDYGFWVLWKSAIVLNFSTIVLLTEMAQRDIEVQYYRGLKVEAMGSCSCQIMGGPSTIFCDESPQHPVQGQCNGHRLQPRHPILY